MIINRTFENGEQIQPGDYVAVEVTGCSSQVLKGRPLHKTTLREFHKTLEVNSEELAQVEKVLAR